MEESLSKPRHHSRLCSAPTLCLWDNKVKQIFKKESLTQKGELFSTLNLKFQFKNYGQTERQRVFLFRLQSTTQTTEHLLQRQQNRAVSQPMHDLCKLSLMLHSNSLFNLLFKSRKLVSNQGVKSLFSSSSSPQLPTQDWTYFINESCPPT